ncbi:MAG: response regulator transcription factor [Bacteroidetes bacterium]|nr:response regulator transcription factor [Bacteroidota bacterium]
MNAVSKPINIVLVDDHKMFLEGLSALLKMFEEINIVSTETKGENVLKMLETNAVDIVITDINMPGIDGMKLAKEIKKKFTGVKILALTTHTEGRIITAMLKMGIEGYILKDAGKEELLSAIKAISRGDTFFSEEVKSALAKSFIPGKKTRSNDSLIELSEREKEILKLIAKEYTQQQIAEKLFISSHTVVFHRRKLFHKFDVKNTAGLIMAAIEMGFLE